MVPSLLSHEAGSSEVGAPAQGPTEARDCFSFPEGLDLLLFPRLLCTKFISAQAQYIFQCIVAGLVCAAEWS